MYTILPNLELKHGEVISDSFLKLGIHSYHEACKYVWQLPYGRNSDRSNWHLVLTERRGTCSTKHALLKDLANELNLCVDLVLGIYPMHEDNTPGVGSVLAEHNLDYVPEAHCFLKYKGVIIDLTHFNLGPTSKMISHFFSEKVIEPAEIIMEKTLFHKSYIRAQYGDDQLESIWKVREDCIKALSLSTA